MKTIARLVRLAQISFILLRYRLYELVFSTGFFRPARFLAYCNPYRRSKKKQTLGERIRLALENLGPIFVKFGQLLSTRRDLIPEEIADELAKLQDRVPPFPGAQVKDIVESAFKKPLSKIFSKFSTEPLASASVAQVHAATLLTGEDVVVKVLRPGINKRIIKDIDLLYVIADLAARYYSDARRFKPREVVSEFDASLHGELDLLREAGNASQLRRNFMDSDMLYIPEVHWQYTCRHILVMERIYGIPVSDISTLKKQGINLGELARRGVEIFFTQVFRDCFFHADMHPGNIFVAPDKKDRPQYLGVDFGIMGSLSPDDQRYLAENLMAFFKRDYRRVAQLHVESGWVAADTRVNEFEADIRTVCEPIFERPLKEISFGSLLLRLFQTARRFNMEVQPQLILLQKTLFNVEGLGRQLYPDLDLWGTAKPFLERWLKSQLGYRAFFYKLREHAPFYLEKLPALPDLVYKTLLEAHRKQRGVGIDFPKSSSKGRIKLWKKFYLIIFSLGAACIVWALIGFTEEEFLHRLSTKYLLILGLSGLGLLVGAMAFLERE